MIIKVRAKVQPSAGSPVCFVKEMDLPYHPFIGARFTLGDKFTQTISGFVYDESSAEITAILWEDRQMETLEQAKEVYEARGWIVEVKGD